MEKPKKSFLKSVHGSTYAWGGLAVAWLAGAGFWAAEADWKHSGWYLALSAVYGLNAVLTTKRAIDNEKKLRLQEESDGQSVA